jgi:hypothetical protein
MLGDQTISVTVGNCGGTFTDDHTISIQPVPPIYLPLIARDLQYAPDLRVSAVQIVQRAGTETEPDYVLVTIANDGNMPVQGAFWVDLYLNPSQLPRVGLLWDDLGTYGKAWYVRTASTMPILPGQSIQLSTLQPDDQANPNTSWSRWPDDLPAGGTIYALVDSYWPPNGLVLESDEDNNLSAPAYVQDADPSAPLMSYPTPVPAIVGTPAPVATPKPRPTSEQIGGTPTPAP